MSVSMRPVRRPKARWYLLSVLAFLVALPLGVAGVVGLAWQDWQHPDSPVDRATLTRGTSYDLEGVYGDYGDVWARLASGDKVSCAFTATTAGATTFTRTFVVPEQHPPKHWSESRTAGDRDTAQVGTFTAPASGAYRIACTDRGGSEPGPLAVRARQAPSGWPPVALYIAIGLAVAGVVWIVVLLRRRARSRLLRTALDAGVEVITG